MAPVPVYLSTAPRCGGIWPVAAHLRPIRPVHTPPDFAPLFVRLSEPVERHQWRYYDFVSTMPLADALAWPVVGEA